MSSNENDLPSAVPSDEAKRFVLLISSLTDHAVLMLDSHGAVTAWNKGAEAFFGYEASEIIGRPFSRLFSPEDQDAGRPAKFLQEAAADGRAEHEDWRLRKDGSRFWAQSYVQPIRDEMGRLTGFSEITRDITERKRRDQELLESEQQFRMLVGGVTDYALYLLDPNGIVTNWNPGAERIKGYAASEIIGQHFSRFYTDHDRAAGVPAHALRTAVAESRYEAEALRVRKDGSTFWANVIIDPIRDQSGKLLGFAKITRDITERRNAQLALEEAQAQRAHAQKMEALGQLTGGVAHDFNNLLMIVSGNLQAVRRAARDNPRVLKALEAIEIATKRGGALTRQLLTFSRRQSLNPTIVRLNERLDDIRTLLASSIGSAEQLNVVAEPNLWPVKIDLGELELALVNLTVNARDAMPHGGSILLMASNKRLRRADTPLGLEGDFVEITVSDTGSGIAPDVLPKVFDPFFTTKPVNKGTGLGLSQVHGFAHQSGGTLTIESTVGKGTTIKIYLPCVEDEAQAAVPGPARRHHEGGWVLLVEDNREVAEVTAEMLELLGYSVEIASNAAAALSAFERRPFDVVISDIVMAGEMDGLDVVRALRKRHPRLAVLLTTGYNANAATAESEFTVLRKPYEIDDLSRALSEIIKVRPLHVAARSRELGENLV